MTNGAPSPLLNDDGSPFANLSHHLDVLGSLPNPDREAFRDQNGAAIANSPAHRVLLVAGPGSGKSYLFMDRVRYWLSVHDEGLIYISTFVRKLVKDLEADIAKLNPNARKRITATTLHGLARSLVERNGGIKAQRHRAHVEMLNPIWGAIVWGDAQRFVATGAGPSQLDYADFQEQMHTDLFETEAEWEAMRTAFAELCSFYNAIGFADSIQLARQALNENPALNLHSLWIIDEFQDFNRAEEQLLAQAMHGAAGVLIAGDDDQALYQTLKQSMPEIIRSYYGDAGYAKAMLPYCSRCGYHIAMAASSFIAANRDDNSIDKIYLPLYTSPENPKVRIVGVSQPVSAVDYIDKLLAHHKDAYDEYVAKMRTGEETDPFLLILTPEKKCAFYQLHKADEKLLKLVEQHSVVADSHSPDYFRIAGYYAAANDDANNFYVRRVLDYEGLDLDEIHDLVAEAMRTGRPLADLVRSAHPDIPDRWEEVRALLRSALEPVPMATALHSFLVVRDVVQLAAELAEDPIGGQHDEGEPEPIETAGTLEPVALMTMVGSKGLSAQHVVIIGCEDVNMRHTTPLTFFVALTRARRSLHLIVSGKARGNCAHPFVLELPQEHCDDRIYLKSSGSPESTGRAQLIQKIKTWNKPPPKKQSRGRRS